MADRPVHWEIRGPDGDAVKEFYGELFGWRFESPPGSGGYHMAAADQVGLGGAVSSGGAGKPDCVTFYIEVPDVTARLAAIEAAGGTTVMERTEVGSVVVGMFVDPGGNLIGLVESGVG